MKLQVNEHAQPLSNGAQQRMIGFLVELDTGDSGAELVAALRQAFLDWKAAHGETALIMKATVKGADAASRACFDALLNGWNDDSQIQGASKTLIDIDYFSGGELLVARLTNRGQAAQGNALRLQPLS